jgi:hypothetical protein
VNRDAKSGDSEISGVTDKNGSFLFYDDQICTFSVGGVALRELNTKDLPNNGIVLEDNLEVARLLQTLDKDGDPNNGIEIDRDVSKVIASENLMPDGSIPATDEDLANLVISLQDKVKDYDGEMVTEEEALAHIEETKAVVESVNGIMPTDTDMDMEGGLDGNTHSNRDGSDDEVSPTDNANPNSPHSEETPNVRDRVDNRDDNIDQVNGQDTQRDGDYDPRNVEHNNDNNPTTDRDLNPTDRENAPGFEDEQTNGVQNSNRTSGTGSTDRDTSNQNGTSSVETNTNGNGGTNDAGVNSSTRESSGQSETRQSDPSIDTNSNGNGTNSANRENPNPSGDIDSENVNMENSDDVPADSPDNTSEQSDEGATSPQYENSPSNSAGGGNSNGGNSSDDNAPSFGRK